MSDLFQGGGRGAPEGIGPIESLAPSPGPGRARVVGLASALKVGGDVAGPLAQHLINRNKRGKDYDDSPVDDMEGQSGGKLVNAAPEAAAEAGVGL